MTRRYRNTSSVAETEDISAKYRICWYEGIEDQSKRALSQFQYAEPLGVRDMVPLGRYNQMSR